MPTVRRSAAALTASAVLCVAFAPAAFAGGDVPVRPPVPSLTVSTSSMPAPPPASAEPRTSVSPSASPSPAESVPAGLYGDKDPTDDGVWRQSLTLLGQYAAGLRPANQAVAWLKGQQCGNGAFPVYRADPLTPCDATTRQDPDSTAAAVQALSTIPGQLPVLREAISWLQTVQNQDGGWGARPGAPSETRSTSLVIGALAAAGMRPSAVRTPEGKNPYDALVSFSLPCTPRATAGAFAEWSDHAGRLVADAGATTAGLLGGVGKRFVVSAVAPGPAPSCRQPLHRTPELAARNGAAYLAAVLAKNGHLDRPLPQGSSAAPVPDPGATADAVAAMSASGYANQAAGALEWLEKNAPAWAEENGPAAYARLIFAAHTTNTDPHDFGGIDLVQRMDAGGPAPQPGASTAPLTAGASSGTDTDGSLIGWMVAVALVVCTGVGIVVGRRIRSRRS